MTAQFPDTILIDAKELSIVGVNGGELFAPQSLGINPVAVNSACWRGYICRYEVRVSKLVLDWLQLSLGTQEGSSKKLIPQRGPTINGVSPNAWKTNQPTFANVYEGLNLEIQFTGTILAGDDFIQNFYVHMGFHSAWKYQTVFELILDSGKVQEIRDVSKQIEVLRSKMVQFPLEPDVTASKEEVESWIAKTFRLDYDLKD